MLIEYNLDSEITLSEITIKNNKWVIFSAYRPIYNSNIETFLGDLWNVRNKYVNKCDSVIIMDDFNIDVNDVTDISYKYKFCDTFSMSNLGYACFTKTDKSSNDLILTNIEHSFQFQSK